MFYFWLSIIFLIITATPFFIALRNVAKNPGRFPARTLMPSIYVLLSAILILILVHFYFYYYIDYEWFRVLKFQNRFWTILGTKCGLFVTGALIAWVFVKINISNTLRSQENEHALFGFFVPFATAFILGMGSLVFWNPVLLYIFQEPSPYHDPVFNKSISFYLFSLPLYTMLIKWLFSLLIITAGAVSVTTIWQKYSLVGYNNQTKRVYIRPFPVNQILFLLSLIFLLLAWNSILDRYRLMYSSTGVVYGAGYTDVHFRIPAFWVSAAVFFILSIVTFISSISTAVKNSFFGYNGRSQNRGIILSGIAAGLLILFRWIIPWFVQAFIVNPNELALELPFLKNNITFTQLGFKVDTGTIKQRSYPIRSTINDSVISQNRSTLQNIRLWDPRALKENLKQQQQIRLYYKFNDIDIGRYTIDTNYREVMLSVRELDQNDLNERSRTWLGLHFIYTHGMGLAMLPVNEFLPGGQPNLYIKNIPPVSTVPDLTIKQPEIYFGELTDNYIFAPSRQPEFNFPSGDTNVYNHYNGAGGIPLYNYFTRFAFGWRFNDYRILFSAYPLKKTKALFYRDIKTRLKKVLPFLLIDNDPYAIVTDSGRIKYVYDTYTYSSHFPYSQPYNAPPSQFDTLNFQNGLYTSGFSEINYIRNSVKVFIDAFDGTVENYITDTSDVIIKAYNRVFPELFRKIGEMPAELKKNIRYPEDLLKVQASMYSIYHMSDPAVFYQREDVWRLATENYRKQQQVIEPYYVMIKLPEDTSARFMLMIPFTPQNRTVMNAWIAGQCDFPEYGKLVVYHFPKGQEVFGPQQIETYIDQNTDMSAAMTLWGQAGSKVIRGNLLTIPLFLQNNIYMLYAEPVFLQAENVAIPEIKRIVLGDQNGVVWAETFDKALNALVSLDTSSIQTQIRGGK